MNHPRLVRGLQRVSDLLRNRQRVFDWYRALRDTVGERRALDQLQDKRMRALGFFDAVDGGDIRVVEAGENLRLAPKPGKAVRVIGEGVREDLQGDLTVELGVSRLPDLPHAALADEGGDIIVPEAGAGTERHTGPERTGQLYCNRSQRCEVSSTRLGARAPKAQSA